MLACSRCGEGRMNHTSVDRFACSPTDTFKCIYPRCNNPWGHVVAVCPSLNFMCKKCWVRGHITCHPDWNTPAQWEESRRIYERYADRHVNGRRRWDNPYFGALSYGYHFFDDKPAPWPYSLTLAASVQEVKAWIWALKEHGDAASQLGGPLGAPLFAPPVPPLVPQPAPPAQQGGAGGQGAAAAAAPGEHHEGAAEEHPAEAGEEEDPQV